MPYKFLSYLTIMMFGFLALLYYFSSHKPEQKNVLKIVCTTSIIADCIRQIGGDRVQVHALMGPGVDPHVYKAREGDVHRLADADIIFYNGLHLEGKMGHIFDSMQCYACTINLGSVIDTDHLIVTDLGMADPHIWHDVQLWMNIVKKMRDVMISQDEQNTPYYTARALDYLKRLEQLDAWIEKKIDTIPKNQRVLITAHDAFSYFGKRYGMEVIGLQGISTDGEISINDIQNLVSLLIEKKITTIFVESSIPQRSLQAVQQAARARNWHVNLGDELYSDALGAPQGSAGTYYDMIQQNVLAMRNGLKSQSDNYYEL